MVHALEQCWRVLMPDGWLLDIRPVHGDARVHVISDGSLNLAGPVDHSGWIPDDEAADKALRLVVEGGTLVEEERSHFLIADYWDSLEHLSAYIAKNWDVSRLPDYTLRRIEELVAEGDGNGNQIRVTKKMRITRCRKA